MRSLTAVTRSIPIAQMQSYELLLCAFAGADHSRGVADRDDELDGDNIYGN